MNVPLLTTKLYVPPLRPNTVSRPHLIRRLDEGLRGESDGFSRRLTLVSAPAGFGKTTLIAAWVRGWKAQEAWLVSKARTPSQRIGWISLDQEDNDPARFWSYVVAALQQVHGDLGQSTLTILGSPQFPSIQAIVAPLLNEIAALGSAVILVLDDYHVISSHGIHEGISYLLDHQPQQMHLVLSTRADPPLPIHRLRALGQLTELRIADLRFTVQEAAAFLQTMTGLSLAPEEVEALESRTEGWIVGLQLAAVALGERAAQVAPSPPGTEDVHEFIEAFSGGHRYVLEYLTEEVLGRQREPVRHFLLQTSVLDRFCGPLCDAVVRGSDSAAMLEHLRRRNLFILPLDGENRWYRYHHLFVDLLGNQLRQGWPTEHVLELHRRASAWHERNGTIDEAIKHALEAKDMSRAASLVQQAAEAALASGRLATLLRWLEALPKEQLQAHPRLTMYQGWAWFLSGQAALAQEALQDARTALQALPPSRERDTVRGELATFFASVATLHEDVSQMVAESEEALAYLPEEALASRARAARTLATAYGLNGETSKMLQIGHQAKKWALESGNLFLIVSIIEVLAGARVHQGMLREAARFYQRIVDLVGPSSRFPPAGIGYVGLASISLEQNDLDAAASQLHQGIELCRQGGIGYDLVPAYCTQAHLRLALGNTEGALEALGEAEHVQRMFGSLPMLVHLAWHQVRIRLLLGDGEAAQQWVQVGLERQLPIVLHEVLQVCRARVFLAQGEFDQVLALCDELQPQAEAAGRMARVIEISMLRALALAASGDWSRAMAPLQRCLELAAPERYVRSFLDEGAPAAELLLRFRRMSDVSGDYVDELLGVFGVSEAELSEVQRRTSGPQLLIEALTPREREVLELISAGYSNQAISEQLVITLNTVKKHTSNIYGKLRVTSRTQAVARAQELGLI